MTADTAILEEVVEHLYDLDLIYIGGAVLPLYLPAIPPDEIRVTSDVDCIKCVSRFEYQELGGLLEARGFTQANHREGDPICRWRRQHLIADVMPTDERILGFGNRWYAEGSLHTQTFCLPSGRSIRSFTPAYYLAAKVEAFWGRGQQDILNSHDFEDIISLIDGCSGLELNIQQSSSFIQEYFIYFFQNLLMRSDFLQIIEGHTPRRNLKRRMRNIIEWIWRNAGNKANLPFSI